ncbi:MAG: endonuclease/exonuclease/phosphatase family protein [bacterium]
MKRPRRFGVRGASVWVLVVLLIAVGVAVSARAPDTVPPRPAPPALRVVTYNIRAGLGGMNEIAEDLRALSPDLVALQEVERGIARSRSQDQAGQIGAALGLESAFAGSFEVEHGGEHGIAILSRWPIAETETFELPRGDGRWPRVALLARIDTPEGPIRFVCVHLARPWGWPLSNTKTRLEQIHALREHLGPETLPLIFAGDLNSLPWSPEGFSLARDFEQSWHPWRDGWGTSFPLSAIGLRGAVKIDHILHDEQWASLGSWVASPGASDHRAVVADLVRVSGDR